MCYAQWKYNYNNHLQSSKLISYLSNNHGKINNYYFVLHFKQHIIFLFKIMIIYNNIKNIRYR